MKNETFDLFVKNVTEIIKPDTFQIKDTISSIQLNLFNYIKKSNLKSLVIGISGGLDSALVSAISRPVCDSLGIKLIGVSIPISSSKDHIEKASYVGKKYCHSFYEMNEWNEEFKSIFKVITNLDTVAKKSGFKNISHNIAQGNIKARLRMTSLYYLAGITGGAVLSTDNYSEYFLGFWTICGDVGDISPIQFIEKGTEEVEIAKYLNIREDIITQKPSDGLNTQCDSGDCDEDQLGLSYREIGPIIFGYENKLPKNYQDIFDNFIKDLDFVQSIINRHKNTSFKRNGPFYITREMNKLPLKFY
jgi:NAD+ synthetase